MKRRAGFLAILLTAGCASAPPPEPPAPPPDAGLARIEALRAAALAAPGNADAQYALANALFDAGIYGEAERAYRACIAAAPGRAAAHTNLGLCLRRLGRLDEAVSAYEAALRLAPGDVVTLRNLRVAAEELGDAALHARAVEELAARLPDDAAAQSDWAGDLFRQGAFAEAAKVYERVVLLGGATGMDLYNLGLCHFNLEAWAQAAAAWEEALKREPRNPSVNKGLVVAYWSMGDYPRAWTAAARCRTLGVALDPEFYERLQQDSGQLGPEG